MPEPIVIDNDTAPAPRFLVVDRRVPDAIRQLLDEADGCLNMSFAVGGSACVRRAIHKAFEIEGVESDDFAASLTALGQKHPAVAPTLFQVMGVLGAGDDPLRGDALKALIATFKGVLYRFTCSARSASRAWRISRNCCRRSIRRRSCRSHAAHRRRRSRPDKRSQAGIS